ncbi:MAG: Wzz/FepE/Etk N-terminal domain-containing protein [Candidatus Omnitrophota bacterium]
MKEDGKHDANRDNIDAIKAFRVLRRRMWLIIVGTLICLIAGMILTCTLPKTYRSEGFIPLTHTGFNFDSQKLDQIQNGEPTTDGSPSKTNTRDMLLNETLLMNELLLMNQVLEGGSLMTKSMTIPDYKKYLPRFTDSQMFSSFVKSAPDRILPKNEKESPTLSGGISRFIEPVYAYTRKDLNDMGQISKDAPNFVVGVKLSGEQSSPAKARAFVTAFGAYINDVIFYGKLNDYITSQFHTSATDFNSFQKEILQTEFKRQQVTGKGETASLTESLALTRRNLLIQQLKYDFFSELNKILEHEPFGYALFQRCMDQLTQLDKNSRGVIYSADILKQVNNELVMNLKRIQILAESTRFNSGPSTPASPFKPRKLLIPAVFLVVGFLFFLSLAFFLEWLEINKNKLKP